jgi:hypothetical protein
MKSELENLKSNLDGSIHLKQLMEKGSLSMPYELKMSSKRTK